MKYDRVIMIPLMVAEVLIDLPLDLNHITNRLHPTELMTLAARSHPRHSLHLNIDASPYDLQGIPSGSNSPSSSARASIGTELTSPARSSMSELVLCSVLCMYDFQSDDADHLEFRKNEILDVVKQEDTGWWAAMRRGGDFIGWIPQAFVNPLTEEMTEKLWNVREELRVYEYDAEQLYNAAPTVRNNEWYDTSPDPSPLPSPVLGNSSSVRSTILSPDFSSCLLRRGIPPHRAVGDFRLLLLSRQCPSRHCVVLPRTINRLHPLPIPMVRISL